MIGTLLEGRYRVLSLLGEGGMGKVYLAEHALLGKRFAVKVLHEEYSRHEDVVKRFQQEAIAASRIGQENIVDVTDFGRTEQGSLFFVMEQLDGQSLAALVRELGQLPVERALMILGQIAKALSAAHACGIVHRDLKPENVIVLQREERADFVKVLDFGISKVASTEPSSGERLTRVGMIMGTPEYMAPEQAAGAAIDHRVDIYALGVIAYELLTGWLPFEADNPLALLHKQQHEPVLPPSQRRPDLAFPEDVEELVLQLLAKHPDRRPQTMGDVARACHLALASLGARPFALSLPPLERPQVITPGGSVPPPVPASSLPGSPDRPTRVIAREPALPVAAPRRRFPLLPVGLGAAAVLLGVGALVFPRARPPVPAETAVRSPEPAPAQVPAPEPVAETRPSAPPAPVESPREQVATVALSTEPPGAAVYEGTLRLGTTPLEVQLREGTTATYRFSLEGYRPASRTVSASDGEVTVGLAKAAAKTRATGLKDNPYEDLKANPF